MNLFFMEMKAHRKSLIIWCIAIILMIIGGMSKYGGSVAAGQSMNDLVAAMPKSLQVILGIGSFDLTKASGYYGVLFYYLVLMAAIHSCILGADIISKEERDKTSEFLMAKPISRNKIITSKLSAALLNIVIFNIITLVVSIKIVGYYGKGEQINNDIVKLMIGMFIVQLIFLFIGTAIASTWKNSKTASSLSTAILLITYILSMVIDLNSKLKGLKYITPFKYYEAKNLMYGGKFQTSFVTLSTIIIATLLVITYMAYGKRDLK